MTDEPVSEAPPPPPSPPPSGVVSPDRSIMIALSYLWLLAFIPLFFEKRDTDVQWHAKHGLVLFAAEFLGSMALGIVGLLSGGLGCLLMPLAGFGVLVLHVVCISKGLQGERFLIPNLSEYADKL
jgi:uncharacterized membrane protein